jgi:ubiquinone/menaquinone biosynthesis C-methylase UbiE
MIHWLPPVLLLLLVLSLTPVGTSARQWLMAKMYARVQRTHETHLEARKRDLLSELAGTVLEIGPGTGVNFQYLPDSVEQWIGIEPNPHMHAQLRDAGRACRIEADFRKVSAEGMDVGDASVDAVLSTLVLCSVPDPAAVLRDICRILKPGGRFVFLEHVGAPKGTRLRRQQWIVKPLWRYCADGCRPDRDLRTLVENGGFSHVEVEEFRVPKEVAPSIVSPHIAGVATK